MMNRRALTFILFAVAAGLAACDEETVTGPGFVCDVTDPVRDLFISPSSASVLVHSPALPSDTVQLAATATGRFGAAREDVAIAFSSSDTTVATVDTAGVVSARRPGTTRITATACGKSSSAQVTVVASVARVTITPASDTTVAGDTVVFTARAFAPDNSPVPNVKFVFGSSNPAVTIVQTSDSTAKVVSSVSASGTAPITAVGEGTTGTASLLILPRVFLAGTVASSGVDAGDEMACGLITTGQAFCWGLNNHGQLGAAGDSTCFPTTETTTIVDDSVVTTAKPCSLLPLRISRDIEFATIAAGDSAACAVSIAGSAYCWGMNLHGELGNGATGDRSTPTLVTTALTFTSITVGGGHSCALATGGGAYCWGDDEFGQLGDARRINSTTPIPVSGGGATATFAGISAGFRHTCALTSGGTAFCWGNNDFGQLGDGTLTTRDTPALVAGGLTFASISAGGDHTCGVTVGGAAFCWGSNADGQLGNGVIGGVSAVPVAVAGGLSFTRISASSGTRVVKVLGLVAARVKVASGHSCGLTTANTIFCWGDNLDLQLGRGPFTGGGSPSGTPAQVVGGELPSGVNFASVTTGSRHSCGVGSDGAAYCWGANVFGALGNTFQAAFRGLPQRVATPR